MASLVYLIILLFFHGLDVAKLVFGALDLGARDVALHLAKDIFFGVVRMLIV